jgi:hypothetical protein
MTELQPITQVEQYREIHQGLLEDGGVLLCPTHMIRNNGNLVGAVSIGGMPTVHFWFEKRRGSALQSVRAIKQTEEIIKEAGYGLYQTMIPDTSPFIDVYDRLGFMKAHSSHLFVKEIGGK